MIELFLVRHGDCNGSGTYIGRGSDVELTEKGIEDIHSLGKLFSGTFHISAVDFLYTSPMIRARNSADILSSYITNVTVQVLQGMEECDFGAWEMMTYDEIEESDSVNFHKWLENPLEISPPGGETLQNVKTRVSDNCKKILQMRDHVEKYKIILVSHKGPLTLLLTELLGVDSSYFWNFRIDRGSVSKLNLYPRFCEIEFLNRK